jgi:hypothetical protein
MGESHGNRYIGSRRGKCQSLPYSLPPTSYCLCHCHSRNLVQHNRRDLLWPGGEYCPLGQELITNNLGPIAGVSCGITGSNYNLSLSRRIGALVDWRPISRRLLFFPCVTEMMCGICVLRGVTFGRSRALKRLASAVQLRPWPPSLSIG